MAPRRPSIPRGYPALLRDLKDRIRTANVAAVLAVNRELVLLYWRIGRDILSRQDAEGWGAKVIDRLSTDLRTEFPDMRGFSSRNLRYMRDFASAWDDEAIVQQVVAKLPWGHVVRVLDRVRNPAEREWYVRGTIEHGWSRSMLLHHIDTGLARRQGKATSNFSRTLPPPQSDLAQQMVKDPYNLEFIALGPEAREQDLERGLLRHLREFLIELGRGFAFVGSQHALEVDGDEFFVDLLFYHLDLRCFVVIDLKMGNFKPEYAGKMNFYLSAADDLLRRPGDQPSIGIILCRGRSRVVAEYSLRDVSKPISIAQHKLTGSLPKRLRGALPSVADLERLLRAAMPEDGVPERKAAAAGKARRRRS